jgi:predicted transposase/invertase (TIGR01784 family)
MAKELLSPLMDDVFKYIFADQRNIDNLTGLLRPILKLPEEEYRRLTIVDPFLRRFFRKDKQGILDIKTHTASGKIIDIEVQISPFAAFRKRILFYLTRLVWEQLKRGDDYTNIQQVIGIFICDHLLPDEPELGADTLFPAGIAPGEITPIGEGAYMNEYSFRNGLNGKLFTNLIKIITIELPKVPPEADMSAVRPWARFFTCKREEEFDMLAENHPELIKPVVMLKKLSWSERRRMIADAELIHKMDLRAIAHDAKEAGIEEGWKRAQRETARKLKALGVPVDQIAAGTGLSPRDIELL